MITLVERAHQLKHAYCLDRLRIIANNQASLSATKLGRLLDVATRQLRRHGAAVREAHDKIQRLNRKIARLERSLRSTTNQEF